MTSGTLRRRGWLAVLALAALLGLAWMLWQPQPAAVEGSQDAPSACAVGSAIASPADDPGLVADCDALLRARPSFDREVAAWSGACSGDAETCVVTMDADLSVGVSFQEIVHELIVESAEGGTITPEGVTTRSDGESVSLSVSWNDATHTFAGWTGACADAETATTCTVEMTEDRTVGAEFSALPADRCSTQTASDCIRAVYLGAPDDYAQVQEIPSDKLLTPDADGRYQVNRGQQVTVVTAAPLPEGWTRFYLDRREVEGPIPTSIMRLIPPVGTTYTFRPIAFEGADDELTFELRRARPLPVSRPGHKPELGAAVVSTEFEIQTPRPPSSILSHNLYNGPPLSPGSYEHPKSGVNSHLPTMIFQIPSSAHRIRWAYDVLTSFGISICLSDITEQHVLCIDKANGVVTHRQINAQAAGQTGVTITDVFDYITASIRVIPAAQ